MRKLKTVEQVAIINRDLPMYDSRRTHIAPGGPPQRVFRALAKEILPGKESLRNLSDQDLDCSIEKLQQACHNAINESRAKHGLPPMPAGVAEKTIGGE